MRAYEDRVMFSRAKSNAEHMVFGFHPLHRLATTPHFICHISIMNQPSAMNVVSCANPTTTSNSTKELPHKRRGGSSDHAKKLKFHSKTCSSTRSAESLTFNKLDPSIPEQKRRLDQRRKMISYGKNTSGYEEYLKQVPKEKRKSRCMETPSTPDYTLDIPNKRWVGQVRAWRRALHNYDPPDLQASIAHAADPMDTHSTETMSNHVPMTVQDRELADAKSKGLLVEMDNIGESIDNSSPTSVLYPDQSEQQEMKELDHWDIGRSNHSFGLDEDDSDDDLL